MSYYQLGTSCIPQTMACTSNHKFLPLHASVYKRRDTYMLQLPGNSISKSLLNPNPIPEELGGLDEDIPGKKEVQIYYGKTWENNDKTHITPKAQILSEVKKLAKNNCKSC